MRYCVISYLHNGGSRHLLWKKTCQTNFCSLGFLQSGFLPKLLVFCPLFVVGVYEQCHFWWRSSWLLRDRGWWRWCRKFIIWAVNFISIGNTARVKVLHKSDLLPVIAGFSWRLAVVDLTDVVSCGEARLDAVLIAKYCEFVPSGLKF